MNNREIGTRLGELIKNERRITNEILQLLNQAEAQSTYLELGYASLFDWLTKGFGYSNAAAYRRIQAARLLRSVPEVREKLETGVVNLTTLCQASAAIKAEYSASEGVALSRFSGRPTRGSARLRPETLLGKSRSAPTSHFRSGSDSRHESLDSSSEDPRGGCSLHLP